MTRAPARPPGPDGDRDPPSHEGTTSGTRRGGTDLDPPNGGGPTVTRTGASAEERPPRGQAALTSTGLIVVAALAVVEGYRQLDLISPVPRHPVAVVFALVVLMALVALTRPPRGGHRTLVEKGAVTAGAIGVITSLATATTLGTGAVALGAIDMLIAVFAIGSAVAGEWRSRRPALESQSPEWR